MVQVPGKTAIYSSLYCFGTSDSYRGARSKVVRLLTWCTYRPPQGQVEGLRWHQAYLFIIKSRLVQYLDDVLNRNVIRLHSVSGWGIECHHHVSSPRGPVDPVGQGQQAVDVSLDWGTAFGKAHTSTINFKCIIKLGFMFLSR